MPGIRIEDRLPVPGGIGTETYINWLMAIIHPHDRDFDPNLCLWLDQIPYGTASNWPCSQLDMNFYGHVDWLRQLYYSMGGQNGLADGTRDFVSVFEWLVVLSIRIEDEVMHDPYHYPEDRSWCWFWVMIHNLGLDLPNLTQNEVYMTINNLLSRNFSPTGAGSICGHCPSCAIDMRSMDWWGQMQYWCGQNFDWSLERAFE